MSSLEGNISYVRAAIAECKKHLAENPDIVVLSQDAKDIKLKTDHDLESIIIGVLSQSDIPIVAEESLTRVFSDSGLQWVVDPLDGTANFAAGFPCYCISIGLYSGYTPLLGVIYDIPRSELYFANCETDCALAGETEIRVSGKAEISQCTLSTGFPTKRDFSESALRELIGRFQKFKKVRMIGAAAMSLVYVAKGAFDVHFEEDTMIWDVAAGLALAKAAGGDFRLWPGSGPNQHHVVATNGHISIDDLLYLDSPS